MNVISAEKDRIADLEKSLRHQGQAFVDRFDANTYLYLSRVMDFFDPFDAESRVRLEHCTTRFLALSFDSDWRFPTPHSRHIVDELRTLGVAAELREIASPFGHDSFLLPVPEYHHAIRAFLADVQAATSAPVARSR